MRIVIDTNTSISALLWGGKPLQILWLAERKLVEIFATPPMLDEFADVINRPGFAERLVRIGRTPQVLVDRLRAIIVLAEPVPIPPTSRDPDDDALLAAAVGAHADAIVSGDKDVLVLGEFRGIPILSAAEFLKRYFPEEDYSI